MTYQYSPKYDHLIFTDTDKLDMTGREFLLRHFIRTESLAHMAGFFSSHPDNIKAFQNSIDYAVSEVLSSCDIQKIEFLLFDPKVPDRHLMRGRKISPGGFSFGMVYGKEAKVREGIEFVIEHGVFGCPFKIPFTNAVSMVENALSRAAERPDFQEFLFEMDYCLLHNAAVDLPPSDFNNLDEITRRELFENYLRDKKPIEHHVLNVVKRYLKIFSDRDVLTEALGDQSREIVPGPRKLKL